LGSVAYLDLLFLYSVTAATYTRYKEKGLYFDEVVSIWERVAEFYGIPSIHMGM
jgi:hypothetical protein